MGSITPLVRELIFAIKVDSFEELGTLIGASSKNIYKWIKGISDPDSKHLVALIKVASTYTNVTELILGQI